MKALCVLVAFLGMANLAFADGNPGTSTITLDFWSSDFAGSVTVITVNDAKGNTALRTGVVTGTWRGKYPMVPQVIPVDSRQDFISAKCAIVLIVEDPRQRGGCMPTSLELDADFDKFGDIDDDNGDGLPDADVGRINGNSDLGSGYWGEPLKPGTPW